MANLLTFAIAKAKIGLPDTTQTNFERFIEIIEQMKIVPILGQTLFNKLITGSYASLKTKVNLVTIYWTYDKYLREGNLQNTAFGAVVKNSEFATNEKYERESKIQSNIETALFYEKALHDFLIENATDYPEYVTNYEKNAQPFLKINASKKIRKWD